MQTEIEITSYYRKHLKADEVIGTREYQAKKLMDILGLIAKIKDRIKNIEEVSEQFFGLTKDGKIKTTPQEALKHQNYSKMLKRVKAYYNNNLSKLKTF